MEHPPWPMFRLSVRLYTIWLYQTWLLKMAQSKTVSFLWKRHGGMFHTFVPEGNSSIIHLMIFSLDIQYPWDSCLDPLICGMILLDNPWIIIDFSGGSSMIFWTTCVHVLENLKEEWMSYYLSAPCMVYLPTFAWFLRVKNGIHIPSTMEQMGDDLGTIPQRKPRDPGIIMENPPCSYD